MTAMSAKHLYSDGDLAQLLAAVALAAGAASTGDNSPHRAAWRQGYAAALAAIALAVGVSPRALGERLQPYDGERLSEAVRIVAGRCVPEGRPTT